MDLFAQDDDIVTQSKNKFSTDLFGDDDDDNADDSGLADLFSSPLMREMFAKEEAPTPVAQTVVTPAVVVTKPQPVDLNDITCQAPTSLFADEPVQSQQIEETVQIIEEQQQPTIIRFNFGDEEEKQEEPQVSIQNNIQDMTPTTNQRDQVEEEEETVQTIETSDNYAEQTMEEENNNMIVEEQQESQQQQQQDLPTPQPETEDPNNFIQPAITTNVHNLFDLTQAPLPSAVAKSLEILRRGKFFNYLQSSLLDDNMKSTIDQQNFPILLYTFGVRDFELAFGEGSEYYSGQYNIHSKSALAQPKNYFTSNIRSAYYRLFLNTFQDASNPISWCHILAQKRQQFADLTYKYYMPLQSTIINDVDLQAKDTEQEQQRRLTILNQIHIDLQRTFSRCPFFSSRAVRDALLTILYVYCMEGHEYHQGMNELCAYLFYIVSYDALDVSDNIKSIELRTKNKSPTTNNNNNNNNSDSNNTSTIDDKPNFELIYATIIDQNFILHDVYQLFVVLMENMNQYYNVQGGDDVKFLSHYPHMVVNKDQPNIVLVSNYIFDQLLPHFDAQLWQYLSDILNLPPSVFLLRWIRCLFLREGFNVESAGILIDAVVASDFSLIPYLCLGLLKKHREKLLKCDDAYDLLQILLPKQEIHDDDDEEEENDQDGNDNDGDTNWGQENNNNNNNNGEMSTNSSSKSKSKSKKVVYDPITCTDVEFQDQILPKMVICQRFTTPLQKSVDLVLLACNLKARPRVAVAPVKRKSQAPRQNGGGKDDKGVFSSLFGDDKGGSAKKAPQGGNLGLKPLKVQQQITILEQNKYVAAQAKALEQTTALLNMIDNITADPESHPLDINALREHLFDIQRTLLTVEQQTEVKPELRPPKQQIGEVNLAFKRGTYNAGGGAPPPVNPLTVKPMSTLSSTSPNNNNGNNNNNNNDFISSTNTMVIPQQPLNLMSSIKLDYVQDPNKSPDGEKKKVVGLDVVSAKQMLNTSLWGDDDDEPIPEISKPTNNNTTASKRPTLAVVAKIQQQQQQQQQKPLAAPSHQQPITATTKKSSLLFDDSDDDATLIRVKSSKQKSLFDDDLF